MTLAWVESPLQLLNAVEWARRGTQPVTIGLRDDVQALAPFAAWLAPVLQGAGGPAVTLTSAPSPWSAGFLRAPGRVVGDMFSGQVRVMVAVAGARDLVVVDDGSATLHLAHVLATDEALGRMGQREGLPARLLGRAAKARLGGAARAGRLTLFTAYDHDAGVSSLTSRGIDVVRNDYRWLKGLDVAPPVELGSRVVLGSALATDGYISADHYVQWVVDASGGAAHYLPHRREDPAMLDLLRSRGMTVVAPQLPAEVVLALTPGLEEVASLPSSTGATLQAILPPTVTHRMVPVPDEWWTPSADPNLRAALGRASVRRNDAHE